MSSYRDKLKDPQAQTLNVMGMEGLAREYYSAVGYMQKMREQARIAEINAKQASQEVDRIADKLGDQARLMRQPALNIKVGLGSRDTRHNVMVRVSLPGVSDAGQYVQIEKLIEL